MAGPFQRYVYQLGPPNPNGGREKIFDKNQIWFTQPKPFSAPLSYLMDFREVTRELSVWPNGLTDVPAYSFPSGAYNDAYGKFVGAISEQTQWGVNLAERKQSVDMISKRALQITRFARKLNRLDLVGAAKALGLDRVPRGARKKGKGFGNLFLEYHFGWEPLVKDIGGAIDLLQKPYPQGKVKGRGKRTDEWKTHSSSFGYIEDHAYRYVSNVTIAAKVAVSNHNLFLASQMGFVNPFSVAWELVPFSFVVDWFTNVGQVLGSMTDFVGVSLQDAYVSIKQETSHVWQTSGPSYLRGSNSHGVYFRRVPGNPSGPTLELKPFKGFSVIRGVTAISLLLQQLKH